MIKRRGPAARNESRRPRRRRSAREVALDVLIRVEKDGAFAAAALDVEVGRASLDGRDAALTTELVMGVLRWQRELDRVLAQHVRRGLSSLDETIHAALRLGTYQMSDEIRIPRHAAVSETVKLVRDRRGKGGAGLVNAVLRNIGRAGGAELDSSRALPSWLMKRFEQDHGAETARELSKVSVIRPTLGIRTTHLGRRTGSSEELIESILHEAPDASIAPSELLPDAYFATGLGPLRRLTAFREGQVVVQDVGAQACANMLDIEPGHHVLDACAGRGGKTAFFADKIGEKASIDAADRLPRKLETLLEEFERLSLPKPKTVCVDLERGTAGLQPQYDRVFLDVPCSGTGTLARRPEIRWRLSKDSVAELVKTQTKMLSRCLDLVAPGGVLVYCTCSLLDEEGPARVEAALQSREGSFEKEEELRLFPHEHGTDGFYAARLVHQR